MPGLPVHHQLLKSTQTHVHWVGDAIQPSHPVIPFPSCPQSFTASGSFPMSQFFASGGQSIGVSASASVLPMNIQDWTELNCTELLTCIAWIRVIMDTIYHCIELWPQPWRTDMISPAVLNKNWKLNPFGVLIPNPTVNTLWKQDLNQDLSFFLLLLQLTGIPN